LGRFLLGRAPGSPRRGAPKSEIESAVNAVKEALKGTDAAAIKSATERLNKAWQAASEEIYKAAGAAAGGAGAGGPGAGPTPGSGASEEGSAGSAGGKKDSGTVIDAEIVDENKK
jgi:molecular chaperone DnaK